MTEPTKLVVNFQYNTEEVLPLEGEELAKWLELKEHSDALAQIEAEKKAEAEAKAALKVAALARLGLTEEEINAFLA